MLITVRPILGEMNVHKILNATERQETNMSWIQTIPDEDASGLLRSIYDQSKAKFGRVINLVRVQSLRPEIMSLARDMYRLLMDGPGKLTRLQRVLIATVVSRMNGCHY